MIKAVKIIVVSLALLVYLVIPFKQQFLNTVHLVSHAVKFEAPHHTHDHVHDNANHHHGYLEFLSQATYEQGNTAPIPVELVNYQFQTPLPTDVFHLAAHMPLLTEKTFQTLFIPILTGPLFDVPTPPP